MILRKWEQLCRSVLINSLMGGHFPSHLSLSKVNDVQKFWSKLIPALCYDKFKPEMMSIKVSSRQGSVRPPIGWLYPNSSSVFLSNSWNEGWFKNEIGTVNLFFWLSPT